MTQTLLWLRWSWRDLRSRWPQVVAIALVIALGTGSYAGLSSVTRWREVSTDNAYRALRIHDLRISLAEGSAAPAGSLRAALDTIPARGQVEAAEERLVVDLQVDASTTDQTILVPGRLYGQAVPEGGSSVDRVHTATGRALGPADAGRPVIVLEHNFARHYGLPATGTVAVSGGRPLEYVGQGLAPEYLIVTTERGGILAEANFAAMFTSLETAQQLAGGAAVVNELLLTLRDPSAVPGVQRELEAAIAASLPGVALTVTPRAEEPSVRINENDIEGDQQLYNIFAVLIFGGAVVAAFNLITRMVEAQRREIGVAMVLGVPPARIAIRPLLVGAQIAVLGVLFGVLVGYLIGRAMTPLLKDLLPLPRWDTSFQFAIFARVAVLGFLLPFLATVWPVWRAVRMRPVDAIRSGYRAARGGGLAPLFRRLMPWGNTFQRMPLRNILRSPRRTLLTALGVAAAMTVLVGFDGLIDTFLRTIERGEEVTSDSPGRMEVQLDTAHPVNSDEVAAIQDASAVGRSSPQLRFDATALSSGEDISLQVDLLDLTDEAWAPDLSPPYVPAKGRGIYLTPLALDGLDARVGDTVRLRHPRVDPTGAVSFVETDVAVLGTHPHPFRFVAYMDTEAAQMLGLPGYTNLIQVDPAAGVTLEAAKRELFGRPAVVSAVGLGETAEALRDLINEFVGFLRVVEFAVLLLALLIAFNAASISVDERTREHATMFAFGVPVRTALLIAVAENFVIGVVATAAGILGGWIVLRVVLATTVPNTMPDIDFVPHIGSTTLILAVAFGVVAVAAAPLLTVRRLRRMDVPAALKVAE